VVEAVGDGVTVFRPGDEVFGIGEGSFVAYARTRADELAPKPQHLNLEQPAAAGVSALTAPCGAACGTGSRCYGCTLLALTQSSSLDLRRCQAGPRILSNRHAEQIAWIGTLRLLFSQ